MDSVPVPRSVPPSTTSTRKQELIADGKGDLHPSTSTNLAISMVSDDGSDAALPYEPNRTIQWYPGLALPPALAPLKRAVVLSDELQCDALAA